MKIIITYVLSAVTISSVLTACNHTAQFVKRKDIAGKATNCIGSKAWAKDVEKKSDDRKYTFKKGDWKCNLFVYDVLCGAGVSAPSNKWHPFSAEQWRSKSHEDFSKLNSNETWQAGDIISNGIHCGVAVNSSQVVAAGIEEVSQGTHKLSGGIVRRYKSQ